LRLQKSPQKRQQGQRRQRRRRRRRRRVEDQLRGRRQWRVAGGRAAGEAHQLSHVAAVNADKKRNPSGCLTESGPNAGGEMSRARGNRKAECPGEGLRLSSRPPLRGAPRHRSHAMTRAPMPRCKIGSSLLTAPSPAMRADRALPFALGSFMNSNDFALLTSAARLRWAAGAARRSSVARGRHGHA
jgi:hypothetical protein